MRGKGRLFLLLSGILLILAPEVVTGESPWPMYFHDAQHTSCSLYSGPETNEVRWLFTLPSNALVNTGIIVDSEGTIYIGVGEPANWTTNVYAIRTDGTLKWNSTIGINPNTNAVPYIVASDGTIYVKRDIECCPPSNGYVLYALDPNGTVKWFFDQNEFIDVNYFDNPEYFHAESLYLKDMSIDDNESIYFTIWKSSGTYKKSDYTLVDSNDFYYLFSLNSNGMFRWMYTFPSNTTSVSPIAIGHDGNIYITPMNRDSNRNRLVVFAPDGSIINESEPIGGAWLGSPAIGEDGIIYIGGTELSALTSNGTILWHSDVIGYYTYNTPIITNEGVVVLTTCPGDKGAIQAFDFNGNSKWIFYFEKDTVPPQHIADRNGNIYFSATMSEKGVFATYALNSDGTLKWTYNNPFWSSPAIGMNSTLYLVSFINNEPVLYAIGPENQQPQFKAPWRGTAKISQGNNSSYSHNKCYYREFDPCNCAWENTYAIDVALVVGSDVRAPADGTVFDIANKPNGGGNELIIQHIGQTGKKFYTVYLHLNKILVGKNNSVIQGQLVAKSGDTGDAKGHPHLHFHIWETNVGSYDSHTIPIERLLLKQVGVDTNFREYDARKGDLDDIRIANKYFESNNASSAITITAHCPVDLIVTDPEGLIVSKQLNEIPGATYLEYDTNDNGKLSDIVDIPKRKTGNYLFEIVPESNALPTDTYSLETTIDGQTIVLAKDVQIQNIPSQPYEFESKLNYADFDGDGDVDIIDLGTLSMHWLSQDCNYPHWCEGTDLNYSGLVDFTDFAIFAQNWLWEKIPADIDMDGDVDFADFTLFVDNWLKTDCEESNNWCEGTDFDHSGSVDMLDFALFAEHWLEGTTP